MGPPLSAPVSSRNHLSCFIAVFALACAVNLNTLPNDFNLDDTAIIRDNPLIRRLLNVPKIFASNYWANTPYEKGVLLYRPLVVSTFAFDYALWGNKPFGFHLTNLVINAINAVLLVMLLALLFDQASLPWLGLFSLLFTLHPVHSEAINMVVGRTELLAAMFGLLAFILYLRGWKKTALFSFFLALISKEIAVTIPVLLFIYECSRRRESALILPKSYSAPADIGGSRELAPSGIGNLAASLRWAVDYLPFAGALGLYFLVRFLVLRGFVAVHQSGILDKQSLFERAMTVIQVLGYYLKLLIVPYPLTPDYSDVPLPHTPASYLVWLPAIPIILALCLTWILRRKAPMISFAIFWFFVSILPVSNLISIGAFLGERFLYLPSVGLAIVVAGVFAYLTENASPGPLSPLEGEREKRSVAAMHPIASVQPTPHPLPLRGREGRGEGVGKVGQTGFLIFILLLSAIFGAMTVRRNFDWKDANTLWQKVLVHQPDNPRANYHVAVHYDESKDFPQALAHYEQAIENYPNHNWNADSRTVLAVKQRMSAIYYTLASRAYKANRFDEALENCRQALTYDEKNAVAYVILGNVYVQQDSFSKAQEAYRAALKVDPEQYEAKENLKRIEEAIKK